MQKCNWVRRERGKKATVEDKMERKKKRKGEKGREGNANLRYH